MEDSDAEEEDDNAEQDQTDEMDNGLVVQREKKDVNKMTEMWFSQQQFADADTDDIDLDDLDAPATSHQGKVVYFLALGLAFDLTCPGTW